MFFFLKEHLTTTWTNGDSLKELEWSCVWCRKRWVGKGKQQKVNYSLKTQLHQKLNPTAATNIVWLPYRFISVVGGVHCAQFQPQTFRPFPSFSSIFQYQFPSSPPSPFLCFHHSTTTLTRTTPFRKASKNRNS